MATNYSNADTVAALNGLYKTIYSDLGVQDLIPESSKIQKAVPFMGGAEKSGANYLVPVILSGEQGYTFGGSAGDFFALNDPVAMNMQPATVTPDAHVLSSGISYTAMSRALASGPQAFENAATLVMESNLKTMSKLIELEILYGNAATGLAAIASINSINSTTVTLTIGASEWAGGTWSGQKGMTLDLLQTGTTTVINTNAALVVAGLNFATKTLTVTGNTSDISAIVTLYGASGTGYVTWRGATGKMFTGIDVIFRNTSSNLFGIDASVYDLWQSNSYNVGGNFTIDALGTGLAQAQSRGLSDEVDLFISPLTWKFLNDAASVSQRVYDKSYDPAKAEMGTEAIRYYTQSGIVNIHSHIYVKQGLGYAFPVDKVLRVGSKPVGFENPAAGIGGGDDIFLQANGFAGIEVRTFGDEAILPVAPAMCTIFTGITNV